MASVPTSTAGKVDPAQIEAVTQRIIEGATACQVREFVATTFPGADFAVLMLAAMGTFKQAAKFDPPIVVGWVFEATREVYRRSMAAGEHATALRALKQIREIATNVYDWQNDEAESGSGAGSDTDE